MWKISASLLMALCSLPLLPAARTESGNIPSSGDFAQAIRADDLAALRKLASSPAAANTPDRLKATPLHYAAIYGSSQAVKILLSA